MVQLSFRQFINSSHHSEFEEAIRQYSYNEFLLKSQAYNPDGKYTRFSEMVAADGRANSLHYKTGFVIEPWILKYKSQIPSLKDHGGKSIPFVNHRFELIESHLTDFNQHECAIHYQTQSYMWLASISHALVLSPVNSQKDADEFISCFTLDLLPSLSIIKIS